MQRDKTEWRGETEKFNGPLKGRRSQRLGDVAKTQLYAANSPVKNFDDHHK